MGPERNETLSKSPKSSKPVKIKIRQVAAMPYRVVEGGAVEIVMVTTRDSGRWILPKGWPIKGMRNWGAAEIEAMEEAGLVGKAEHKCVGHYIYVKQYPKRSERISVEVFPFAIERQLDEWPEKGQREIRFFPPEEAARLVSDVGVGDLILHFVAERFAIKPPEGAVPTAAPEIEIAETPAEGG